MFLDHTSTLPEAPVQLSAGRPAAGNQRARCAFPAHAADLSERGGAVRADGAATVLPEDPFDVTTDLCAIVFTTANSRSPERLRLASTWCLRSSEISEPVR